MGKRQPVHKALLARIEKSRPDKEAANIKRQTEVVTAPDPRGLKRQAALLYMIYIGTHK